MGAPVAIASGGTSCCCNQVSTATFPCCPDVPVPAVLNYALTYISGASCPCLDGLTGHLAYQTTGPYAGFWVSPIITLSGCLDVLTGLPLPSVDIVVIMYWAIDVNHVTYCCAGIAPYPPTQGSCTFGVFGPPFGNCFGGVTSCDPFEMLVTRVFHLGGACEGNPNPLSYCGSYLADATVQFHIWA